MTMSMMYRQAGGKGSNAIKAMQHELGVGSKECVLVCLTAQGDWGIIVGVGSTALIYDNVTMANTSMNMLRGLGDQIWPSDVVFTAIADMRRSVLLSPHAIIRD